MDKGLVSFSVKLTLALSLSGSFRLTLALSGFLLLSKVLISTQGLFIARYVVTTVYQAPSSGVTSIKNLKLKDRVLTFTPGVGTHFTEVIILIINILTVI